MAHDQQLSRIEQENGLVFGLKWSLVGFALALCLLAGCSNMMDNGPQRYNTVAGGKRAPALNPDNHKNLTSSTDHYAAYHSQMQPPVAAQPQYQPVAQPPVYQYQHAPSQPMPYPAAQSYAPPPANYNPMPQLQPTQSMQAQPMMTDASIQAEITALENDLAASQMQRNQIASQYQDDGWLPDLGISDWFGGSSDAQPQAYPQAGMNYQQQPQPQPQNYYQQQPQPMAQPTDYPVVNLPPPPLPNGGVASNYQRVPDSLQQQPVNYQQQPIQMPNVPDYSAMQQQQQQQYQQASSVNVPLAPEVTQAMPSNVPGSLIPPGQEHLSGAGYLGDSRYSTRGARQAKPY